MCLTPVTKTWGAVGYEFIRIHICSDFGNLRLGPDSHRFGVAQTVAGWKASALGT